VESGKSAFIVAELKIDNDPLKAEHITFTNDAGVKLQVQPAAGPDKKATYIKVLINETSHEEVQRVTAGYTIKKDKGESENRELAWIDVISYNSEPVDLVIATANGQKPTVPLSRLEQEINRIYGQSVIRFRLSQIDLGNTDFDKNGDNLVDAGSTGMLSNYTAETRAIKRAVRRHQAYDKKAFYIVMAPEASEGAMLKGRWALKTQVGFVFNPKGMSDEQFIHTVAHESGHGIFRLWHTFSSKNNYQLTKGATTNLMDYSTKPNATDLFKYQWDYCHNPENMTGLFQDDEEGEFEAYEYLAGKNVVSGSFKEAIGLSASNHLSFVSSAGWVITIPSNAVDITFNDNGTLMGFTITEDGKQERYVGSQYTKGKDNGKFAGFLKEFGSSEDHHVKVYKDSISKCLEGASTNVYLGIINIGNSDAHCKIYLFEGEYPLTDVRGNYNTGGNKQPKVNAETIKDKLLYTYIDNKVLVPAYGNKIKYLTSVESEHACNNCEKGKIFYEEYESTAIDEENKYFLTKISQLICDNENEIISYEMLKQQINWDYQRLIKNSIWYSNKISFKVARNTFWKRADAWKLYFQALEKTKGKIQYYNERLNSNISEDDFRIAVYYLNAEFLATLTLDERVELLQIIFKNNVFINENWFNSGTSDVSLITKIVSTLDSQDLSKLLTKLIDKEKEFENQDRDVLFEVISGVSEVTLKDVSLELKLESLQNLLGGSLVNLFGATNYQTVITKIIGSIKDENASKFFGELKSTSRYLVDDKPLLNSLRNKLRDFLNSQDSYTEFFKQIKRLSDARYIKEKGNFKITKAIVWDVKNVDAVLISYVRNNNDFDFNYDEGNNTVSISTCVKKERILNDIAMSYTEECIKTEYILLENTDPFELIGITIINDISPFSGGCNNGQGGYGYCGEMFYIPAIFVEYLEQNVKTQRWKNLGWNTFNVVITAATLGEGAAAITAIRTAQAGTKVAVAAKHAYTLLDLTYTVTNITLDATGVEKNSAWNAVGYLFAAKTSYDLISKSGVKGLSYLKKASPSDRRRIINKLGLKKNGKKLTEAELEEYIKHAEAEVIRNPQSNLAKKFKLELKSLENAGCVSTLNKVDNIIDDVGNNALKEDGVLDELVKTNNVISDVNKKFWANHEANVTKHLRETYGNTNVGRQITIDITLKKGNTITCRVDNLVKEGNTYRIIDAKCSTNKQLHIKTAEELAFNWSTKNQEIFYNALKKGEIKSVKPRGKNAQNLFRVDSNSQLKEIIISNHVDFFVNDIAVEGYSIYKKTMGFRNEINRSKENSFKRSSC
jgi:hypothetical protein